MLNQFTGGQFCYWINKMDISYEEAAELLKVCVSTIENYAWGVVDIPPKKATECRLLLRLKTERLRAG
jgi:hypothetical protein